MRVGVVGLGQMGLGMASVLAANGFAVRGFDLEDGRQAPGVERVALPALLAWAEAVVTSLPSGEAVAGAVEGLAGRAGRVVVIDTSTVDPAAARDVASRLGAAGHGFLDAPVSGGPAGAAAGQLAMMVGGAAEDLAAVRPVVDALASRVVHVGPSGAGSVAKLVNNLLVAAHMLTTAEALRLAEAAGVDAAAVLEVINGATGRTALSEVHFPRWVLSGRFDSGFSTALMRKDVRLALALAEASGVALPVGRVVAGLWNDGQVPDEADFTRKGAFRDE